MATPKIKILRLAQVFQSDIHQKDLELGQDDCNFISQTGDKGCLFWIGDSDYYRASTLDGFKSRGYSQTFINLVKKAQEAKCEYLQCC